MNLHAMKLVTIVCESYAREPVTQLLRIVGANGWTLFPVEGDGSHGKRFADIQESANIQIEVIVPPEVSAQLLEKLSDELFAPYAMIAFESEVRVLRPGKF